ncbi:argininosuccinate lyase [Thermodesulfobium acidiphilum]|uniref:Argininosuccinate lyase n=1 Tax=Thermodesulfobium acidiphilum TaxID=1794699 RepID=A0A2R4VZI3_THEAF|nr:argininosuccinate lyase [Thermodesulfobium acidiphilum]AWB09838.1 argininosuccinate lyase [Thermodesulfobium acidiphilum]
MGKSFRAWQGRLPDTKRELIEFSSSLDLDRRFFLQDSCLNSVYAEELSLIGLISKEDFEVIKSGIKELVKAYLNNNVEFSNQDEDIHMAIERLLSEKIGETAFKMHAGKSRNDQVITDFKMFLRIEILNILTKLNNFFDSFLEISQRYEDVIMPAYTHTQQAQPIIFSHWVFAHLYSLFECVKKLIEVYESCRMLPLGSAAIAGSAFNLDRFRLAKKLGFEAPTFNSIETISSRDFALDFLYALATISIKLSCLAQDLITFSTSEYGFINLPDEFCTGSSIMPQKKNPDFLELIRGRSSIVIGNLISLLTLMKGLSIGYHRDLQEDKTVVFSSLDIVSSILVLLPEFISKINLNVEKIKQSLNQGLLATDIADYLAKNGVPFREAHSRVGSLVRLAEEKGVKIFELDFEDVRKILKDIDFNSYRNFDFVSSVNARNIYGGTSKSSVKCQRDQFIEIKKDFVSFIEIQKKKESYIYIQAIDANPFDL